MMNYIWSGIFLSSFLYAALCGNISAFGTAIVESSQSAVTFVIGLAGIRADRIIEQIGDPALTTTRHVHVSLDVQAIGFLDLLVRKYHMLFKNRSDVVELLLLNIAGECGTPSGIRYYASRLAEVLDLHPVQVRKH